MSPNKREKVQEHDQFYQALTTIKTILKQILLILKATFCQLA